MSTIRRAIAEDLPGIAGIHRTAFHDAMPHMPMLHTPEEDVEFYTKIVFPHSEIWLTERNETMTGFIAFRPGWIDQLYIHPTHQRRGLGTLLLTKAQSANRSLNLWTFQCNQTARYFYEKHGFTISKMTNGADNEEHQPDILYIWRTS